MSHMDVYIVLMFIFSCNASYLEKTERITKFEAEKVNYNHPNMVVVTEWEEFGAKVCRFVYSLVMVSSMFVHCY